MLKGARGIGKTFFLNYLLSKYSDILDEKKIIWVRINLPVSRNFDDKLDHWIEAQITKVLIRNYDEDSQYIQKPQHKRLNLLAHLRDWAKSESNDHEREIKRKAVERLERIYAFGKGDTDISPEIVPMDVCGEVRRYAEENGLGFIIVFDGFDRLDYDTKNERRFRILRQGLERLATGAADSGFVYLCVTRTNTFSFLKSTYPFFRAGDSIYTVARSSIENIVDARVTAI